MEGDLFVGKVDVVVHVKDGPGLGPKNSQSSIG